MVAYVSGSVSVETRQSKLDCFTAFPRPAGRLVPVLALITHLGHDNRSSAALSCLQREISGGEALKIFVPFTFAVSAITGLLAALGVSSVCWGQSATFQPIDTTTQGNWPSAYGQDGYLIANGAGNPPSYATLNFSRASTWTWTASTSDPRALYTGPTGSTASRIASTYYSETSFSIDLMLAGGAHQVALYLLDLDTTQRAETISILDPNNNNAVLDTRSFAGFHNGEYAIWTLQGHVIIQVTKTAGLNAVVSGLFFGLPPTLPPTATITAPANSTTVTGNAVAVTATVAATSPATVSSVQFQLDGANLGSPATSSPYTISWDSTATKNGSHTLTAVVTDSLGQHATSAPVTVTSSNGGTPAPTVSIVAPINASIVSNTLTVTAAVSSSAPPVSVQFQLDNANLGTAVTATPYSISWDTTKSTNASHSLTATATDGLGQSTLSAPVSVTVANGSAFISGYSSANRRNDFSGFVGMNLTVGAKNLSVLALGRICVNGNTATHLVKLVNAASASDVPGGSVSVPMAACSPGQFVFASLANAVTLTSGASYYLVSQEAVGGDTWYDAGTVTGSADAAVSRAIYSWNGGWIPNGSGSLSYVPPNFLYSVSGGATGGLPTVSLTNPLNNSTVSSTISINATASATAPATVASVQFQLDGNNFGSIVTTSPYSNNWDTATVANGSHTLSAIVRDSLGQTANSGSVSVVVNNLMGGGGSPGGALLTGYGATLGNLRNDFASFVGMSFTVNQPSPILVSALGRICIAGNTATHMVKLVDGASWKDVSGAAATVSMAGCTPRQFVYANLPNNIQLAAGSVYYLVSQEAAGGDTWYDAAGVTVNGAAVNGSVYFYSGVWVPNSDGAKSYVPPNLKFAVAGATGAPPTVTVTNPAAGVTVSGAVAVTATALASAPSTVSSVTFYLDGAGLGTASAPAAFSVNWDTTQTNDGAHTLTAIAVDWAGLTTVSTPVVVTVSNGGGSTGGGSPFIVTFGFFNPRLRNDFSGFAGMQLTVTSATPVTVSFVGRACAQSDSGVHTVKFVAQASGLDIPGASALVNMSGCTPGQFSWSALPSPIFLSPGVTYYLVSQEFAGGDLFYEKGPITTQSFASVISAVYLQDNGVWHRIAPPNYSYVPPNFK